MIHCANRTLSCPGSWGKCRKAEGSASRAPLGDSAEAASSRFGGRLLPGCVACSGCGRGGWGALLVKTAGASEESRFLNQALGLEPTHCGPSAILCEGQGAVRDRRALGARAGACPRLVTADAARPGPGPTRPRDSSP